VVGASGVYEEGWIPTDVHTLNLLKPGRWLLFFKPGTIHAILAEHVWEHLSPEEGQTGAATCYMFLRSNGYLRIAVPDGFHPSKDYIDYVKPGGSGAGADDHKVLYNYRNLSTMLERCGFSVRLLEYFDETGKFHFNEWDRKDGMIHRSSRYDERNSNGELNYTSLIIDAVK
jgi:predicted SAM-dependent methyltransferase